MTDVNSNNVEPIMTALAEILGERPAVVIVSNKAYMVNDDKWLTYTVIETPDPTDEGESWIENDDADPEDVKSFLMMREKGEL